MATTAQYLEQLQTDKQTLVDNLIAKGISATNDETFTNLIPKISEISGGESIDEYWDTKTPLSSGKIIRHIKRIPFINTMHYSTLFAAFSDFESLVELDLIDTSNVTNMSSAFFNCRSLMTIPLLNTSKVTQWSNTFSGCSKLNNIPLLDMSSATITEAMFKDCKSLTTFSQTNLPNNMSINSMFYGCTKLESISLLDCSSVRNVTYAFYNCTSLKNFGGLKNLGKNYLTTASEYYSNYTLTLNQCTMLTEESLINILNNLYDIASLGCKSQKVILGSTNLGKLSTNAGVEALDNAKNKGWVIS